MNPSTLVLAYEPAAFAASIAMALFASYIGLDVALRVHESLLRAARRLWLVAGGLVLGTGIWTMHFVGMSAAQFPFAVGYAPKETILSWVAAVVVATVLLAIAAGPRLTRRLRLGAAVLAGSGALGMHYLGLSALWVVPTVRWSWGWTVVAWLAIVAGAATALAMFDRLRDAAPGRRALLQAESALVLGGALVAMHYAAMAGEGFDAASVCLTTDGLDGRQLDHVVTLVVGLLLGLMLLMTTLHRWSESHATRIRDSLESAEERLRYVTFNDVVTGLPNRLVFQDRLKRAIDRCAGRPGRLAVAMIDIDGFRYFNERHGERVGDELLRRVASTLGDHLRPTDTLARIGPDDFLVLVEDLDDARQVLPLFEGLRDALDRDVRLEGFAGHVSASLGVALLAPGAGPEALVNDAAAALTAARQLGGGQLRFFETGLDSAAREDALVVRDLRVALAKGQLELHYQPKIHAGSGLITGAEALVRWNHPTRGQLGPATFIGVAERYGLINALGAWVVEDACRQIARWQSEGVYMRVAINLSAHQLRQQELADEVSACLVRFGVDASRLTFEITESVAMDLSAETLGLFDRLRRLGLTLSIDDFGTGYSSLGSLRRLPFGQLKIDRSFVRDLDHDEDARAVVKAVIDLAHALRIEVVAEGVETDVQHDVLVRLGADKLQGYLFSRPMTAAALTEIARERGPVTHGFRASIFAPA